MHGKHSQGVFIRFSILGHSQSKYHQTSSFSHRNLSFPHATNLQAGAGTSLEMRSMTYSAADEEQIKLWRLKDPTNWLMSIDISHVYAEINDIYFGKVNMENIVPTVYLDIPVQTFVDVWIIWLDL